LEEKRTHKRRKKIQGGGKKSEGGGVREKRRNCVNNTRCQKQPNRLGRKKPKTNTNKTKTTFKKTREGELVPPVLKTKKKMGGGMGVFKNTYEAIKKRAQKKQGCNTQKRHLSQEKGNQEKVLLQTLQEESGGGKGQPGEKGKKTQPTGEKNSKGGTTIINSNQKNVFLGLGGKTKKVNGGDEKVWVLRRHTAPWVKTQDQKSGHHMGVKTVDPRWGCVGWFVLGGKKTVSKGSEKKLTRKATKKNKLDR